MRALAAAAAATLLLAGLASAQPARGRRGADAATPATERRADSTVRRDDATPGRANRGGDKRQPVTVDADRMERFGKESLVVFTGSVVARQDNSVQYADRMEVYLDEGGDRIVRTVSTGSVKIITRDCRTGTAKRAEYFDLEQRLVLSGSARVWEDENVVSGETITIFLSQDRSLVQGGKQDRVKAVFYPRNTTRDDSKGPDTAGRKPAKAPCAN